MKFLLIFSFLSASILAFPVDAQQSTQQSLRGPGWGLGGELLYQDSTRLLFDGGSSASLDSDFGIALTFGYRFSEHLELGFAFDWQQSGYNATLQSADLPDLRVDVSGDLEAFTPRMWLSYNFLKGPVTPFVNGGIGWTFIDTNIPTSRAQVGCWWDPWWGYICAPYQNTKSIDEFTYTLGAGVGWDISPGFTLRLAFEKHWIDYSKATSTPDLDQLKLGFSVYY